MVRLLIVWLTALSNTGESFSFTHSTSSESLLAIWLLRVLFVMSSQSGRARRSAAITVAYTTPFINPGMMPKNLFTGLPFIPGVVDHAMRLVTSPINILEMKMVARNATGNNQAPNDGKIICNNFAV